MMNDGKTVTGFKQATQSILASDFDKQSQLLVARSILNFKAKNVKSKRLKLTDEDEEKGGPGGQALNSQVSFRSHTSRKLNDCQLGHWKHTLRTTIHSF
jgi:hypothetical protein